MSLLGSMNAAISGMTAQSRSLGHISDNVANSQTVGYKRLDTDFETLVTSSSPRLHTPGAVVATPNATNTVQGSVEQVENPLALAITGQGFFSVARRVGEAADGSVVFSREAFYSRAGDFQLDDSGYLVNGVGDTLEGWTVNTSAAGVQTVNKAAGAQPVRIPTDLRQAPTVTTNIELSANLPTAPDTSPKETVTQVYDALGNMHELRLAWAPLGAPGSNQWRMTATAPTSTTPLGTVDVHFGTAAAPAAPPGTIGQILNATGPLTFASGAAGTPATVTLPVTFPGTPATPIVLNLGRMHSTQGLTQFNNGPGYELRNLTQNGAPEGAYSSVVMRENGDVVVNFSNGNNQTVAKVPVVTFANADKLQRVGGQAFTTTRESGLPIENEAGANGSGSLASNAVERSNVDIASEFSKLIVAQRAYSANTRIVSASDEMLQDTINMKR